MGVLIKGINNNSIAQKSGIMAGDILLNINDEEINDVLDYMYYCTDKKLKIEIRTPAGDIRSIKVKKDEYEDLGLEFNDYLMDSERSCANKCIFCFMDQLPKGMRKTLYYKDDDVRLSFLVGNFVTLTNISDEELDRLIKLKISPLNISVHTLIPGLRVKMMQNKNAAKINEQLIKLADAGINIRCQIVLCKDVNDGAILDFTLDGLKKLYPALTSVSVVPVGITKYRDGLYDLTPFDKESSIKTVNQVEKFGDECIKELGTRLVYLADEFYLKAGCKIPPVEHYEEFEQLDNGVGLIALFEHEFKISLEKIKTIDKKVKYSIITGESTAPFISSLIDEIKKVWPNLDCNVYSIKNDFFGHEVNVAGLVTAGDIIKQLSLKDLGTKLFIPRSMLRYEGDMFLDSITVNELANALNVEVCPVYVDGESFFKALTEEVKDV